MENRRHTRNYFPEPKFQLRFLKVLVVGAILQMGLTSAILYSFLRENYTLLVKYAGLDEQITNLLYSELKFLIAAIAATFFLYLVGLTLLGIVFSHRIAGVMYAIKRTIRFINQGKDVQLKLRTKDEFQDVQDEFNAMVKNLRAGNQKASA